MRSGKLLEAGIRIASRLDLPLSHRPWSAPRAGNSTGNVGACTRETNILPDPHIQSGSVNQYEPGFSRRVSRPIHVLLNPSNEHKGTSLVTDARSGFSNLPQTSPVTDRLSPLHVLQNSCFNTEKLQYTVAKSASILCIFHIGRISTVSSGEKTA